MSGIVPPMLPAADQPGASDFERDAVAGLSSSPRTLPCKYFYDERGAALFREITELHARTVENLRIALGIFMSRDVKLARRLVAVKIEIRNLERASAERHLERLRQGRLETLQTSTLHLDVLRDLKRINAHITSVAYPILDEAGELRESRLRTAKPAALGELQPSAE